MRVCLGAQRGRSANSDGGCGTSSVRASLYDRAGNYLNGTDVQLFYQFKITRDGGAEIDVDKLIDLVDRAIERSLSVAGDEVAE